MRPGSIFIALVLTAGIAASSGLAQDREAASRQAGDTFRNLHLFREGRGMHIVPGLFNLYEWLQTTIIPESFFGMLKHGFGFTMEGKHAVGLFNVQQGRSRVGVLGCVGCHSGRVAGQTVIGLGNKNVDPGFVGKRIGMISKPYLWTQALRSEENRKLIEQGLAFTRLLSNPETSNLTQGMVPVSNIRRWFYTATGRPPPADMPRMAVKVPHLWGYEKKREAGLFCDGFGDGKRPGWAALVELAAGQDPGVVRGYEHDLEKVEGLFNQFLPPRYPFAVDAALARSGQDVYRANCMSCHGTYERDAQGLPIFQSPQFVEWETIRTDADRLDWNTPAFRQIVAEGPLKDIIRAREVPRGYFAPRLEGVWARFPYLHNGAAPNLRALLTPPAQRPRAWSLRDAGDAERFDAQALGLTMPAPGSREEARLEARGRRGDREVYWIDRVGHANQGHEAGTWLPEDEKHALIEYLKTL